MSFAPVSFKQGDSIPAYRIVRVSAAQTVAMCSATTDIIAGVTVDNANASTQAVPVAVGGIAKVQFNDSIAAGALVMTNSVGQGIPFVEGTAGVWTLGVALQTCNATGAIADVLINPRRFNDVP